MPTCVTDCSLCRHKDDLCQPGLDLLRHLRSAVSVAAVDDAFELTGSFETRACDPGCLILWRATRRACWLFCGVRPGQGIDDLIAAVERQRHPPSALTGAGNPPPGAAAMICLREEVLQ
jgi:predicted metal-binding protein